METKHKSGLWLAAGIGAAFGLRNFLRSRRQFDFQGRVVLITGGARGLGLLLARELAKEGAKLALCSRNADELANARTELTASGAEVFTRVCDLTDRAQIESLIETVQRDFGPIDVLINNAGVIEVGPMEAMTIADYEEAMAVHFWAPLHASLAVLPGMKARRRGRIVNIASFGGKVSVPHMLPYSASKFALVGLSEGMRAELLKDGVYVTTVCPGLLRTGSQEHAKFKAQNKKEYALFSMGNSNPLVSMNAEDAARQIVTACKNGDAEIVLTLQAQIADKIHGLLPGATADLLGVANRFLPGMGGIETDTAEGKASHSILAPSILTALNNQATARNNEAL